MKLLKAGCRKFREEFKQKADFDPLEKCVTVASSCNRFWRKKLLKPNTIASEPLRGWHGSRTNQSVKAFKWLAWQEHLLRLSSPSTTPQCDHILHANNEGEQRISNFLVDGFQPSTRTVYEFNGCLWHGCLRCHPHPNRDKHSKLHPDRTLQEMYEATQLKRQRLESKGYTVVTKWECDWDREVKYNKALQEFLASYELVEPLNPRDAFFGGRTNAVRLHHEANESKGEKLKYVDVTSLYPWVNKKKNVPCRASGHHKKTRSPKHQWLLWNGQSGRFTSSVTLSPSAPSQTRW